jgi:hypothetical protein
LACSFALRHRFSTTDDVSAFTPDVTATSQSYELDTVYMRGDDLPILVAHLASKFLRISLNEATIDLTVGINDVADFVHALAS